MKISIRTLTAALVLTLLGAGCDKQLEIEPAQSISEGLALSTDANVKGVLLGAYDGLSGGALLGGNVMRDAELLGADGEIRWVGTFTGPREVFNHQMNSGSDEAQSIWIAAYRTINICNNVLDALAVVNEDDRETVEGEARFIRAFTYYILVQFYAKPFEAGGANSQVGVPLVLRPTRGVDDSSYPARNTVNEVYTQILADLNRAYQVLPEDNGAAAGKYAAGALLARVHLTMGNYTAARDAAGDVINSGLYELVSPFSAEFNNDDNTTEDIFAMQVSNQDGENNMVIFYSIPAFGGRDGDIEIEQKHLALYDPNDERLAFHYDGNGATRTTKWRDQYKNIPILRLGEMHVIRAECNARLGASADDDYNATHTRAGLAAKTGVTLADVLLERRLELAHEGHRIHDIKRLKGTADGLPYDDNKLVYPIPLREMIANPNLVQNPGY